MPYHTAKSTGCPTSRPWAVINDNNGRVMGCHTDEAAAKSQMAALYVAETKRSSAMNVVNLPDEVERRLATIPTDLDPTVVTRGQRRVEHRKFRPTEFRRDNLGNPVISGYAIVYDYPYDVAGGPPDGWSETMKLGAASHSVRNRDDVRLLINHDGTPLARTRARTLSLESDDPGLFVRSTLDGHSPLVQTLTSAMERGDMDEMSVAFKVIRQEWNSDWTERRIDEIKLFDVSVVTAPANPATFVRLEDEDPADARSASRLAELRAWRDAAFAS